MLSVSKPTENQINLELKGTLDAETMRKALDRMIDLSEGIKNGRMLYRIPDFAMPTPAAIAVEFSRLPKLFGLIGKFSRCAVLTDSKFLRLASEFEGAVIPGLDIKAFELGQDDAAQEWLDRDES